MEYLRVKNWQHFQHYKDRNPPWIKLHFDILASKDWVMLADASKLLMVVCMMIASRKEGHVPNDPHYLKRVAYLDKLPNLTPLIECGFLEIPLADASKPEQTQADARPETETDKKKINKKEKSSGRKRKPKTDLATWEAANGQLTVEDVAGYEVCKGADPATVAEMLRTFRAKCGAQDYRYADFKLAFSSWDWADFRQKNKPILSVLDKPQNRMPSPAGG